MKIKAVAATTHIDRHNCKITKEALEDAVNKIKNGDSVPAMCLGHDMAVPPLGKITDAWLEPMEDGEYKMLIIQETFDSYKEITLPDGSVAYEEFLPDNNKPFSLKLDKKAPDKLQIHTDFVNFESKKEYESFVNDIKNVGDFEEKHIGRKALIPDPEIIITLTHGLIAYIVSKKIIDKATDKIIDSMVNDISKLYDVIKCEIVSAAKHVIPKNRPITYIFEAPGEVGVEFLARTNDPNMILSALEKNKLQDCFEKVDNLKRTINADKVQFILNDDGIWEFNFLLTKSGHVIGTPESHKRRERRFKLMEEEIKSQENKRCENE